VVISEQRERWLAAGSPSVPTLVVDGEAHVLQHPAQAAALLGLETPPALRDAVRVAWDLDEIAQAVLELAMSTPWKALLEPVPGYGRTPLALAVDTAHGIGQLPDAFMSGWFHWPGNPRTGETGDAAIVAYEASVVAGIAERHDLLAFVRPVAEAWRSFVAEQQDAFEAEPARPVRTPRGELTWVELLEAQRLHAAQHYRQAAAGVVAAGYEPPPLDFDAMYGLRLPVSIY
jgi:hypothetical protein